MQIGEIAQKSGVSRDTVRLYEKLGLLGKVTRPHKYNNYKEYGEENLYRIKMIKEMQRIGLTLKECRGVIESLVNDRMNTQKRIAFIQNRIEEVDKKIKSLKQIKSFLQEHIDNNCAFNKDSFIAKLKSS